MASLFETYESEFQQLTASLKKRLATDLQNSVGEARKDAVKKAKKELEEVEELLEQMELELKNVGSEGKTKATTRFRTYQHDVDKLATEVNRSTYAQVNSNTGFASPDLEDDDDELYPTDPTRGRLLMAQERLANTSESIRSSQRLAEESEQIGIEILSNLNEQRQTINRAQSTLEETNANLSRSDRVLRSMARRALANKMLTGMILLTVAIIIFVILYLKLS
eukprot:comp21717_c0_seq1/m.30696 comp21717_c0_seq1/g.30696  ORF comp21717_c0_seq1/g.30696 comp21717_c0_seq1/m.30696 type:complete len:223 (-) comp21717_c0_seq1:410-1078(-)